MKKALLINILAALTLLVSCGGGGGTNRIRRGWNLFTAGEYATAHANFSSVAGANNPEAYVGLGWVCVELDSMPAADRYFGLAAADSLIDGYAGWTATLWSRGSYASCIDKAAFVLRHDPAYFFEFKSSANFQDMIWYQASGYLHLSNYGACLTKIQQLDSGYSTNLGAANVADVLAGKLESLAATLF